MHQLPAALLAALLVLSTSGVVAGEPSGEAGRLGPPACGAAGPAIQEAGFVPIGGVEQWVTITGAGCDAPVILFLHGGPGNPMSPYAAAVYAGWEKDFILVQWDQRGAGRTFGRNADRTDLSIALMTRDGVELAEVLAARFGQRKVILVGGSWGSALGVHMIKARPELFHAFIGAGQLVHGGRNPADSYRLTLALARSAGDTATVTGLETLGPPPWTNPRGFGILRRATRAYEAKATTPAPKGWWTPAPAYATPAAEAAYEAGEEFSYLQFVGMTGDGMLSKIDLPALGPRFEVPIFLVHGAEDLVTTPAVAKAWFDGVEAPDKAYRLLPATGHDPNAAMIAAQHDILIRRVLPLTR